MRSALKVIKMDYGSGIKNVTIYRNNTPINLAFSKNLKSMATYSFRFKNISEVAVKTFS